MRISAHRPSLLAVLVAMFLPSACSDPAGPEMESSLQVLAFASGVDQLARPTARDIRPGGVSTVEIDRILVVLGRLKLETAGDGTVDFTDERSLVIELDSGDDPVLALAADVPLGTYKELELAIDKLERGHPSEQDLIDAFPGLDDASVLVVGTVTRVGEGEERFSFASPLDVDLEVDFSPPLVVDSLEPGEVLLSLRLDASGWFRDSSGALLDPRVAAHRSSIEAAIQRSIELFEDANRDGRP
jgi:hypothetical protein